MKSLFEILNFIKDITKDDNHDFGHSVEITDDFNGDPCIILPLRDKRNDLMTQKMIQPWEIQFCRMTIQDLFKFEFEHMKNQIINHKIEK